MISKRMIGFVEGESAVREPLVADGTTYLARTHRRRSRGRTVAVAAILAAVLVAPFALTRYVDSAGSSGPTLDVTITSCVFAAGRVTLGFEVGNYGSETQDADLSWLIRDSAGEVVADDATRVTVPPGQTVRGSQTTTVQGVTGGTCNVDS